MNSRVLYNPKMLKVFLLSSNFENPLLNKKITTSIAQDKDLQAKLTKLKNRHSLASYD